MKQLTIHEVEKAVIASLILDNEKIPQTAKRISDDIFTDSKNKVIYSTIKKMFLEGVSVDLVTLANKLIETKQVAKYSDLVDLVDNVPISKNITHYIDILKKEETKRKLVEFSKDIKIKGEEYSEKDPKELLSEIQSKLLTLVNDDEEETLDNQLLALQKTQIEYQSKPEGSLIGISTGYNQLDDSIQGFRPGHLWVIGGYTGIGKTTTALNIIANLIKQKKKVLFFSIEMTEVEILAKLIGILSNQNADNILKGYCNKETQKTIELIKESGIEIITNIRELSDIQFSIIEKNAKNKLDVIFVDYLQIVQVKGLKSDYEITTEISYRFQDIAKRIRTPLVALSQLNLENVKVQSDDVSGFKGSGAIEASANFAIKIKHGEENTAIYRNKLNAVSKAKGKVDIMDLPKVKWGIQKNRHGKTGYIDMRYNAYTGEILEDPYEQIN